MKHYSRNCIFCIFSFLLFANCNAQSKQVKDINDDSKSVISKSYIDIIEKTDSIVWYLLDPMCEVDTTAMQLQGYGEILLMQTDTVLDRCNALRSTLLYPSSFKKSDIAKESTFLPDIAIRFFSTDSVVTFSYSFYCDLCHFECDGKYQEIDGEMIRKSIITIASEVFPNDRYIRNLKRKEK